MDAVSGLLLETSVTGEHLQLKCKFQENGDNFMIWSLTCCNIHLILLGLVV